jgi:predicted acyltransferase
MNKNSRLASVDALRGLLVAAMLLVNNPGSWDAVYWPLEHAAWHGCTPTDLIFPSFLFIVGVSLALALGPRLDAGTPPSALRRGVLLRALRILLLGLALHALAWWLMDRPHFRPMGVLQRIAICFGVVGMIALHLKARAQWLLLGAILLGWWALLALGGDFSKEGNLASRLDAQLLGPLAYEFDAATGRGHDPEGLLSTLPSSATTLLGLLAGSALRRGHTRALLAGALAALALGGLWSMVLPLNKQLWTSSFVLWTGGWAMLALLALHGLVDRRGWPALGRSFGVNAIAAYAGAWISTCVLEGLHWMRPVYAWGFEWMTPHTSAHVPSLAFALVFVLCWWLVVKLLDHRKIYFKV